MRLRLRLFLTAISWFLQRIEKRDFIIAGVYYSSAVGTFNIPQKQNNLCGKLTGVALVGPVVVNNKYNRRATI